jgi:putative ABC transport system permease protein
LFGGTPDDRDLENEIESHLQLHVDDNLRAGMSLDEARRRARVQLGGVESVKEAYRDRRSIPLLETTLQDARYAIRTLRRNRGATLVGILVMALGIGANTAVFSVVHAVLLNPLPYPDPDRIVTLTYLYSGGVATGDRSRQVSVPDFLDWQRASTSFDAMAYFSTGRGSATSSSIAEFAVITRVSDRFFRAFAVQPASGRAFSDDEIREGGPLAAMISERYARQQFGEPQSALGRSLRLPNQLVPIVGVLPAAFDFPAATDIWLPMRAGPSQTSRRGNNFVAVARLKPGVRLEQAQAEMSGISARLEMEYPETNRNIRVLVTALQREMVGDVASMLYLLLGAVGLVLLIACATMATLLLAKATARVPEIAIRGALGASRSRIVRQLLVEASVQAFAAGGLGVAIAIAGTRALVALSPPNVPRLQEVAVNGSVLVFTLFLCVLVSILFGLPPALQAARVDVNERLRLNTGRVATGGRGSRTREALVVAEIAIAVILVTSGTLLVRSLVALQQSPLGFQPAKVLLMQASAAPQGSDWSGSRAFFQGVVEDVARLPGVLGAGAIMGPPGRVSSESGYWLDRMPKESPLDTARPAVMNVIAPGTFGTLGIPIRRGRDFRFDDRTGAPRVVIVNDALARAAFDGRDPVGRVIVAGFDSTEPMTIVGVVGDVRQYGPDREPQPEIYMPFQQHFYNGATLYVVVRAATDPAALAPAIQRKARERSPEVPVRVTTMDALLAEHVATPKFRAWLLSLFGVVALCLAMAGVYGVMAYVAGQRSKEIGVRMALGATAQSVLWLMLGRGLKLAAMGLAAGVAGALASARLVSGMLYEVRPYDVVTYTGVVLGLGLLSLLATYLPARRATRVDPLLVLRQE